MRIISGSERGRRLETLDGTDTRPTADRVKESWFNIINVKIRGASVLDLFSGSGALGIEALSRGCKSCVFVEKAPAAVAVIEKNLKNSNLCGNAVVTCGDVYDFLNRQTEKFDFIFMDPPYCKNFIPPAMEIIEKRGLLAPGGTVVAETQNDEVLPGGFGSLKMSDKRKYGKALLNFYKNE